LSDVYKRAKISVVTSVAIDIIYSSCVGFWGIFPGNNVTYCPKLKRNCFAWKHVFRVIKHENWSSSVTLHVPEKTKRRGQSKMSQRCYISPTWGETPVNQLKFAWLLVSLMQSHMQNFKGYSFRGDHTFDCPIDFCMGLGTCSACALPVVESILVTYLSCMHFHCVINSGMAWNG